jgi:hypothetical protein
MGSRSSSLADLRESALDICVNESFGVIDL